MALDPIKINMGIQMNQIFKWFRIEKNPLVSKVYTKIIQRFDG